MKIQYASDLHLEFGENSSWLKSNPLKAEGDIAYDIIAMLIRKTDYLIINVRFSALCSFHPKNHCSFSWT